MLTDSRKTIIRSYIRILFIGEVLLIVILTMKNAKTEIIVYAIIIYAVVSLLLTLMSTYIENKIWIKRNEKVE